MKPHSSEANKQLPRNRKKAGIPANALPHDVAWQKFEEETSRPLPQIAPSVIQDKICLAERQITDLTETLEWFLVESHLKIRNHFRATLGDKWKYFYDLVSSMRGEICFLIIKSERERQGLGLRQRVGRS